MSEFKSPFLESLYRYMITRGYSKRTVSTYIYWIRYFIRHHKMRHPTEMDATHIEQFLTFLAVDRKVATATQGLALNAIAFLFKRFLEKPMGNVNGFRQASRQRKLPVVLTRAEVAALLNQLTGVHKLIVSILYGSGLRRIELARLRVKDVDFNQLQMLIWFGKGSKHRITTLAPELVPVLRQQMRKVALLLEQDCANARYEGVWMPESLARKHPKAARTLAWQYLFPSSVLSMESGSEKVRRHHIDESSLNKPKYATALGAFPHRLTTPPQSHNYTNYSITQSSNESAQSIFHPHITHSPRPRTSVRPACHSAGAF